MALRVSSEVGGLKIDDAPLVHVSGGNSSGTDEFAQPSGGFGVVFIVKVHGWQLAVGSQSPSPGVVVVRVAAMSA